jgi:hypothetical protein
VWRLVSSQRTTRVASQVKLTTTDVTLVAHFVATPRMTSTTLTPVVSERSVREHASDENIDSRSWRN